MMLITLIRDNFFNIKIDIAAKFPQKYGDYEEERRSMWEELEESELVDQSTHS